MFQSLRSRLRHSLSHACAALLLSLIFSVGAAMAQSTFGAILGTVKDNSGAVVPKATVKATNTDENTSHQVTTNGNGDYEFLNIVPGHYTVEVTAQGFERFSAMDL